LNPFKAAAASFGIQGTAALVHDTSELESVLAAQAREPNGGLIVMPDTFTTARRAEITALAARHRLPTVYPFRYFAQSGGLLSYGTDLVHDFRRAATYADRILKGAKPSELPVQGPVKFELVINLKTAKALGLEVSANSPRPRRRGDRIAVLFAAVQMSLPGTKLPCRRRRPMSEAGGRTDSTRTCRHGRFCALTHCGL
jgi:ABC-type uncharacterized transport system substrate-binding protein